VAAQGPGADRVRGYMANTDIFLVMIRAFGWEP
jgi:alkaline phosphatase